MRKELARAAARVGAQVSVDTYDIARATLIAPTTRYPAPERTLAVGPAGAIDKQRDSFSARWDSLVGNGAHETSGDVAA
ncbi:MAG: hypothetical protein JWN00_2870 [Actinomycetia bacterium]|nr:hypothetical protein [Actinomycetes bacterium]